jgi:tagatose-6-phosphate ketose/aldose isomerase
VSTEADVTDDAFIGADQLDAWMSSLATVPPWDELLAVAPDERARRGYADTLPEICQQPLFWSDSAWRGRLGLAAIRDVIRRHSDSPLTQVVLTGSGSSEYAAECVATVLQAHWNVPARSVPAALLLMYPSSYVTASGQQLVISFARSGDSPESTALVDLLLEKYPACRHVAITCNAAGKLATAYASDPRVEPVVLAPATNDRSLVMTSSFTNMVVAGQALAARPADGFADDVRDVAASARAIIRRHAVALARVARQPFRNICYLASGPQIGAAREAALKMMEMSGGAVTTIVETPLGLRHGPMAAMRADTVVVAGLPSSPRQRSYTLDVLREIKRKGLAGCRVVVGCDLPDDLTPEPDVAVSVARYDSEDNGLSAVLDVLVGQILAFFRCMAGGLHPDAPSPEGVITRVVPPFQIYR